MASRPRQAVYRGGKWHIKKDGKWVPADAAFQNVAWRSWRQRRGAGRQKAGPREHSVVTLSYEASAGNWTAADQQRQDQRDFERTHRKSDIPKKFFRNGAPKGYTVKGGQAYERRHATDTVGGALKSTANDLIDVGAGIPASFRALATDPVGTIKEQPQMFVDAYRNRADHPGIWGLTALSTYGAGVNAALRAGNLARTGSIRLPEPGTFPLTMGDVTTNVPLSRSPVRRPLQRERLKRMQAQLDGETSGASTGIWGRIQDQTSAAAKVGRSRRELMNIRNSERRALMQQQGAAVAKLRKRGVLRDKAALAAINVIATAGDAAFENPIKAVQDKIRNHLDAAARWEEKAAKEKNKQIRNDALREAKRNREYVGQLQQSLEVLRNPTPQFQEALRLTREGERSNTANRIANNENFTQENANTALSRQAAAAVGYRGAPRSVIEEGLDPAAIVGQRITATDRGNRGVVKAVDTENGTATVFFHNKTTGVHATKQIPLDEIVRDGGSFKWEELPPAPEGSFFYTRQPGIGQKKTPGQANAPRPSPYGVSSVTSEARAGVAKLRSQSGKAFDYAEPYATDVIHHQLGAWARLTVTKDMLGELWQMGSDQRTSWRQVPVRDSQTIGKQLREYMADLEDYAHSQDQGFLSKAEQRIREIITGQDDQKLLNTPLGDSVEGVRWVDRAAIKPTTSIYRSALKGLDYVNAPARFGQLYTRPAYLLNLFGNAGMGAWDQGLIRYGKAFYDSMNATAKYGAENEAKIASLMGESKSFSYAPNSSAANKINRKAAGFWNRITDYNHRNAVWLAEAERAGFKTPERVDKLLNDKGLEAKRVEVTQRARDSAVDFDSLTPIERDVMTRLIYFYPWVSRGSAWAVRAVLDQPLKALVATQAGQVGTDEILKAFGNLGPMWQRLAGYVPVGKGKNGLVDVINSTSVNTFGTALGAGVAVADTVKGAIGVAHGQGFSDAATPIGQLYGSQFGDNTPGGLMALLKEQPLYGIGKNSGLWGKPSKTFPETGAANAAVRWAGGGFGITGMDPKQRETQYLREQGLSTRGPARARAKTKDDVAEFVKASVDAGLMREGQPLPKKLRRAWNLRQQRAVALSTIKETDRLKYQQRALEQDSLLLVKLGVVTMAQHKAGMAKTKAWDADRIQSLREKWAYRYFGGSTIARARRMIREASSARP